MPGYPLSHFVLSLGTTDDGDLTSSRIFLIDTVAIQMTGQRDMQLVARSSAPDLGAARAIQNLAILIPSAFASALALFTFGTTKQYRDTMYCTFVPKKWQRSDPQQSRGRETPPLWSTAGRSAADLGLGRRFTDRGSWVTGLWTSGSLVLQETSGPREPENVVRANSIHPVAY